MEDGLLRSAMLTYIVEPCSIIGDLKSSVLEAKEESKLFERTISGLLLAKLNIVVLVQNKCCGVLNSLPC